MNKCSPVEIRKSLIVVETYKNAGIDFVAIPVKSTEHKDELVAQARDVLVELLKESVHE